jgi:hypothetical protein
MIWIVIIFPNKSSLVFETKVMLELKEALAHSLLAPTLMN